MSVNRTRPRGRHRMVKQSRWQQMTKPRGRHRAPVKDRPVRRVVAAVAVFAAAGAWGEATIAGWVAQARTTSPQAFTGELGVTGVDLWGTGGQVAWFLNGEQFDPARQVVHPGDTLVGVTAWQVDVTGTNLTARLGFDETAFAGGLTEHLAEVQWALVPATGFDPNLAQFSPEIPARTVSYADNGEVFVLAKAITFDPSADMRGQTLDVGYIRALLTQVI